MIRIFFKFIFFITGWKVHGGMPVGVDKCVLIISPHTSNMDFFIGLAARSICRIKSNFLVKSELFKNPIVGWFLRGIGGIAVERSSKSNGVVDSVLAYFETRERLIVTITPEGTRSKVTHWKTGFYRIADAAHVPIVMVGFDYKRKVVHFLGVYHTTGDLDNEVIEIKNKFKFIVGRHPELGTD